MIIYRDLRHISWNVDYMGRSKDLWWQQFLYNGTFVEHRYTVLLPAALLFMPMHSGGFRLSVNVTETSIPIR